jgi:hypothetical protein
MLCSSAATFALRRVARAIKAIDRMQRLVLLLLIGRARACASLAVCLTAICMSCVCAAPSASAVSYVDGISDQNLPHWNGASDEEASFKTSYFANLFETSWVGGSPASHIKFARWVVQWNVMNNTGSEQYKNLQAWYKDVKSFLGLTPEIALANYEGALPSSAAEYRSQLAKILTSFPVNYVEAWNEPNHEGVSAAAAANYWKEAHSVCQEVGCTAIAGDFLDERYPEEHMVGYEKEYKTALNGTNPENWGIHPYAAIKYRTKVPIEAFKNNLPSTSDKIWFTEAGAYLCQLGVGESTEAEQRQGAEYLVNTLIPAFAPTHVFYYYFMSAWNEEPSCASYTNSSLYNSKNQPRTAASVIYGGTIPTPSAPKVSTNAATGIQEERATLNGTVNPNATATHYYFQYGPTSAYGSDIPALPGGNAGSGTSEVPVSATVTGLEEGAIYHYRLVAENYWGTSYGTEHVVTTAGYPISTFYAGSGDTLQENWWNGSTWGYININMPIAPGSSPAADLFPLPGQYDLYFRGSNGELEEAYYEGEAGWHLVPLGHAVAADTTPTIRHPEVGGSTVLYYAGSGNTLQESWWTGSEWGYYNINVPIAAGSSPAVDPHPLSGQDDVYFRGSNGELQEEYYTGELHWNLIGLGHAVEEDTTPTIRHPEVGGETVLYYAGSGDTLQESWWTGSTWNYININAPIGAGSSPAVDPHPLPGEDDVYFRGSNGELEEDYYQGEAGWHLLGLGHAMAAGTTPTIVHPRVGGDTYVFYVGSNGVLQESWWNGSTWQWASLGAAVQSGTSPAAL